MKHIKQTKISFDCKLVSLDIQSLFTNAPPQKIVVTILNGICKNKEAVTFIYLKDMTDMLVLH